MNSIDFLQLKYLFRIKYTHKMGKKQPKYKAIHVVRIYMYATRFLRWIHKIISMTIYGDKVPNKLYSREIYFTYTFMLCSDVFQHQHD